MALMSVGLSLAFLRTDLVAAQVAVHQSCGFCSDQPGLGDEMGCSAMAVARTLPSSSQIRVLVPLVPMSMPSRWGMAEGPPSCGNLAMSAKRGAEYSTSGLRHANRRPGTTRTGYRG